MKQPIFTGSGAAIVTPFTPETVDYPALRRLIDFQLLGKTDAIIVCGTTGEAATMSYVERMRTIETTVRHVDGRIPVIAGTGSNSTENAITLSKDAALAGVDGVLVVTPYYNKATQDGLIRHYYAVADAVGLPLIVYHVPSRTGVTIAPETLRRTLPASSDRWRQRGQRQISALIQKTRELCPEDFYLWSGNDEDTAAICLLGGKGVISVAANVMPRAMHDLTAACLRGDFVEAGEMQLHLRRLIEVLFREVNPFPVKTALSLMGYCQDILRLPLSPPLPRPQAGIGGDAGGVRVDLRAAGCYTPLERRGTPCPTPSAPWKRQTFQPGPLSTAGPGRDLPGPDPRRGPGQHDAGGRRGRRPRLSPWRPWWPRGRRASQGFACFLPEARDFTARQNTSEIAALYLLRSAQGLGLGRRLLEAALGRLPPHQDVVLYVLDKNRRAIRFYESMGFRLTGRTLRQETDGGAMVELEMLRSGREG